MFGILSKLIFTLKSSSYLPQWNTKYNILKQFSPTMTQEMENTPFFPKLSKSSNRPLSFLSFFLKAISSLTVQFASPDKLVCQ